MPSECRECHNAELLAQLHEQVEQERLTHAEQIADLEMELARKTAKCEMLIAENEQLRTENDLWHSKEGSLHSTLQAVTSDETSAPNCTNVQDMQAKLGDTQNLLRNIEKELLKSINEN